MKVLSISTSSSVCAVAVIENYKIIYEKNLETNLKHSEILISVISEVLENAKLGLEEIDLIGIDIGPGSFTGIRIGIATIKAFVDSLNKKVVGVSSLDALSINDTHNGIVCSIIDAKNSNVYAKIFEGKNGKTIEITEAEFINIDDLIKKIKQNANYKEIAFVGDGALEYKEKILKEFPNSKIFECNKVYARNIGMKALEFFENSKNTSIEPLYLRKPQAEQNFEKKN